MAARALQNRAGFASKSLAGCVFLAALGFSSSSAAYCRATTCNPEVKDCVPDEQGCLTVGLPLWWRRGELDLLVDQAGSEFSAIDEQQAFQAVSSALSTWSSVVCGDDGPRKAFVLGAQSSALLAEVGNGANEVRFIDTGWPYGHSAVGRTTLSFDTGTGEILEADVELNSEDFTFALNAGKDQVDLQAVLSHEIGHALGLGHSNVPDATMQPESSGFGIVELRSLEPDDEAGICAVHADSWQAEPAVDNQGGCAFTPTSPKRDSMVMLLVGLGLALIKRRSRRG